MISPLDQTIADLRTSCTKDEAVAKLIGWMQGPIRARYIDITEHGIPAEQLVHLHSLDGSLQDILNEQREAASNKLHKISEAIYGSEKIAVPGQVSAPHIVGPKPAIPLVTDYSIKSDDPEQIEALTQTRFTELKAALQDVKDYDELIKRAVFYFLDIDDELDKGELSELKIDQESTNQTGTIHLRLRSVNKWAQKNYGISILDIPEKITISEQEVKPKSTPAAEIKPWEVPDPSDPIAKYSWYTPARYFARQAVIKNPELIGDRLKIAKEVARKLPDVNYLKRGGVEPLVPATIKKAFTKIKFG